MHEKGGRGMGRKKRKIVWAAGIVFMLFLLTGCGRELEDREFPSVLTVTETPLDKALAKEQKENQKYVDYGQAKAVVVLQTLAEEEAQLKEILLYLETHPVFARNMLFFVGDKKALDAAEKQKEELGENLEDFYKNGSGDEAEICVTVGEMLDYLHNQEEETAAIPRLVFKEDKLTVKGKIEIWKQAVQAGNFAKWKTEE